MGQELGHTSAELMLDGMNISMTSMTLEIRPSGALGVMVTRHLVFPGPYTARRAHEAEVGPNQPGSGAQGSVPVSLTRTLAAQAAHYRKTTCRGIEVWPPNLRMLQQFADTALDFQAWRRWTRTGPGAGTMAS